MVAHVNKTYIATLELDPRAGQWMADIEGLPVHTWGRSLARVKQYALEALALHLDVPEAEVSGRVTLRRPQLPAAVLEAFEQADTAKTDRRGSEGSRGQGCRGPGTCPRR
jgi:hypothetical protein